MLILLLFIILIRITFRKHNLAVALNDGDIFWWSAAEQPHAAGSVFTSSEATKIIATLQTSHTLLRFGLGKAKK